MALGLAGSGLITGFDPTASGFGKVLQVVTATYSTQISTTSTTYVTTGLEATITPVSTSNKVLALVSANGAVGTNNTRGSWSMFRGAANSVFVGSEMWILNSAGDVRSQVSLLALDSPSTTSAQVYTLGFRKLDGGSATTSFNGVPGVMILMEIAA